MKISFSDDDDDTKLHNSNREEEEMELHTKCNQKNFLKRFLRLLELLSDRHQAVAFRMLSKSIHHQVKEKTRQKDFQIQATLVRTMEINTLVSLIGQFDRLSLGSLFIILLIGLKRQHIVSLGSTKK